MKNWNVFSLFLSVKHLLLSFPLKAVRGGRGVESNIFYCSKTAECREIDLGSMSLFTLEYALKFEDRGHIFQRAVRIYGIDCKTENAT